MPFKTLICSAVLAALMGASPAFAASQDRVSFSIQPVVKAQLVTQEPGLSVYRVVSNSGFTLHANDIIGDVSVDLNVDGAAAQLPGRAQSDMFLSGNGGVIYRADRRTAQSPGTLRDQSVLVEISYSKVAEPDFNFVPVG